MAPDVPHQCSQLYGDVPNSMVLIFVDFQTHWLKFYDSILDGCKDRWMYEARRIENYS